MTNQLVTCAACSNNQYEQIHPLDRGGKFAWVCKLCDSVNENGKIHLLENIARFTYKDRIIM